MMKERGMPALGRSLAPLFYKNTPMIWNETSTLVLYLWVQHQHFGRPVRGGLRAAAGPALGRAGGHPGHRALHAAGWRRGLGGAGGAHERAGAVRPPAGPPARTAGST